MPKHAYLSASSSHRWLECPPSAKLCAGIVDSGSPYAQQGTDAHALCEYKVEKYLGRSPADPTENLTYFDSEMDECTDQYCSYVIEQVEEAKKHCRDPLVLVEEKLDFSKWVPEGFGTGDCVIIADDVLHIIDFKYGLGVLVDANENPQMMCYALGAIDQYDCLYDIETVRLTIFQPRRENISTFEISKKDLLHWAETILKPTAALAYDGKGEFKAGDHCQFCKVKATCRKRAEYNLDLAKYDFVMPAMLENSEIAAILPQIDELTAWANDIKDYALQQALSGVEYEGFKVVAGSELPGPSVEPGNGAGTTDGAAGDAERGGATESPHGVTNGAVGPLHAARGELSLASDAPASGRGALLGGGLLDASESGLLGGQLGEGLLTSETSADDDQGIADDATPLAGLAKLPAWPLAGVCVGVAAVAFSLLGFGKGKED